MATVRIVGLEPTRPKALEPKSSASAKFRQLSLTAHRRGSGSRTHTFHSCASNGSRLNYTPDENSSDYPPGRSTPNG